MSPQNPIARLLASRARALSRYFPAAVAGSDVGVHQARVASRRLRETVPVVTAGLRHVKARQASRKLRLLTRSLGTVRELDVALQFIDHLQERPGVSRAAVAEARAHVLEERERRRSAMAVRLKKIDVEKLQLRLERVRQAFVASGDDQAWRLALAARLVSRARGLDRAVADAGQIYSFDALHRVRIAAKKLRYAVEMASALEIEHQGAFPASAVLSVLKKTQETLGTLHDLQRFQQHVGALAARGDRVTAGFGHKQLARLIEDDCRRLHGRYVGLVRALRVAIETTRGTLALGMTTAPRHRSAKMSLPASRVTRTAR